MSREQPFHDTGPTEGPADALVLDIGEDVGALVLYADETCLGLEIDLSPAGQPHTHHTHTLIRRRRAVNREFIAGVYPELRAGTYTVWSRNGQPLTEVSITGGQVTEVQGGNCLTSTNP